MMDRDVIVERTAIGFGIAKRYGRCVLSVAQEIDFDKMHLTAEHLSLLGQVQLAAVLSRSLVREAQNFDRGDQPLLISESDINFDKGLPSFIMRNVNSFRLAWGSDDCHSSRRFLRLGRFPTRPHY